MSDDTDTDTTIHNDGPCPRCSECVGDTHHWSDICVGDAEDEPEHPAALAGHEAWYECKHCDAWRLDMPEWDESAEIDDSAEPPTPEQVASWLAAVEALPPAPWCAGEFGIYAGTSEDSDCVIAFATRRSGAVEAPEQSVIEFLCAAREAIPALARAWLDAHAENAKEAADTAFLVAENRGGGLVTCPDCGRGRFVDGEADIDLSPRRCFSCEHKATVADLARVTAERDEARRDAAHLRKPYTVARRREGVTDWAAEAIARAPLLVGLCASSTSMGPAPAELYRVMNNEPRGPLTLTQEGAVEVFLEEGPAAMVALVAERDELRLEILALRGDKAGAISGRWVWTYPCWSIFADDELLLAKVATTNLLTWTNQDLEKRSGLEQATSVRDGMRRCEARLAGGAS